MRVGPTVVPEKKSRAAALGLFGCIFPSWVKKARVWGPYILTRLSESQKTRGQQIVNSSIQVSFLYDFGHRFLNVKC